MKAVAVTGYGRQVDVARRERAGFDGHLSKPASLADDKELLDRL